jgi:hypothetical protein
MHFPHRFLIGRIFTAAVIPRSPGSLARKAHFAAAVAVPPCGTPEMAVGCKDEA